MNLPQLGTILIFIGFILVFIAMVIWIILSSGEKVRGGGIIMIGPFPLIFGTDRESVKLLVLLVIILMIIMVALILVPTIFWRYMP